MIRNVLTAGIAAIPLTALTDITQYLIQDWEYAKWVGVLIVIDTALGIWKHLLHKDASSDEFWSKFSKKVIVYIVLMILSNVLAHYTVAGSPVGVTHWMSEYLCIFMIVREAVSIVENIQAIYPILPIELVKRFKDFGENGEYIRKEPERPTGKLTAAEDDLI